MADYIANTLWANPPITDEIPGPRQLSLLTRYEFRKYRQRFVGNVHRTKICYHHAFPIETKVHGFDNNAAMNVVTDQTH